MKRPVGITVLAYFHLLFPLLALLGVAVRVVSVGLPPHAERLWPEIAVLFLVLTLPLLVSFGLFRLRNWARIVVLAGAVVTIFALAIDLWVSPMKPGDFVGLAIEGFLIWYLRRPDIKSAFGLQRKEAAALEGG